MPEVLALADLVASPPAHLCSLEVLVGVGSFGCQKFWLPPEVSKPWDLAPWLGCASGVPTKVGSPNYRKFWHSAGSSGSGCVDHLRLRLEQCFVEGPEVLVICVGTSNLDLNGWFHYEYK